MGTHLKAMESMPEYEEFCICLGRKIAWVRRCQGLSQKELSKLCGISPSYCAKIEGAKGSLGTSVQVLYLIAKTLRVDVATLVYHDEIDYQRVRMYKIKQRVMGYESNRLH